MRFITGAKTSNASRPALWIRNTWRGYEYCTSNPEDENAAWNNGGYGVQLYVVYFKSEPTIINLFEQTIGTEADMAEQFEYVVAVTQVVTTVTRTQTRRITGGRDSNGYNNSRPYSYTDKDGKIWHFSSQWSWNNPFSDQTVESATSNEVSSVEYSLVNSGTEAITLFHSSIGDQSWHEGDIINANNGTGGNTSPVILTQTRTWEETINSQVLVITQCPKDGFTTTNDNGDGAYVYTTQSAAEATTWSVTYTNTRDSLPVELHVAVTQNGGFVNGDEEWRSETQNDYTVTVPISTDGTSAVTSDDLVAKTNSVLKTEMDDDRRFIGVYYGTTDENGNVVFEGEVTSISFVKPANSEYYSLCLNDDPTIPFDDYQIYYVYCEIPRIYYVASRANGALTKPAAITLEGNPISMGNAVETSVTQGTLLEVAQDAVYNVAVGAGSDHFAVPMVMDGADAGSLSQMALGFGVADVASTNSMDGVTHANSVQLKFVDMVLKWSADGTTWSAFTGKPAVYVIYKEAGHDLTINVTSLASDDDKLSDTFTVTISSVNLVDGVQYVITGYTDSNGNPIETVTPESGVITLTLKSGDSVTIQSLHDDGTHPYVVKQTPNAEDCAQKVLVDGKTPLSPGDDGSVSIFMERDRVVDFTNTKGYTVTFVDEDGETILKDATSYWYGTKAEEIVTPETPAKERDETNLFRFKEWVPAIGAVVDNVVYMARYRPIKIPQLTQRATGTDLVVALEESKLIGALNNVGIDILKDDYSEPAASTRLNEMQPNGLRLWECLRTGTPVTQKMLDTALGKGSTQLSLTMATAPVDIKDLGYDVYHVLRKYKEEGESVAWEDVSARVKGEYPNFEKPAFAIDLLDAEGKSKNASGFYRVVTQIVPKHREEIINEIPSPNIIAVLEVNSGLKKTMTAIPWVALPSDPDAAALPSIAVNSYVQIGQLGAGDAVYSIDANGIYEKWMLESGDGNGGGLQGTTPALAWTAVTTVANDSSGAMSVQDAPDPATHGLSRGAATWVERASEDKPYFLVGQYAPGNITVNIAGGADTVPASTIIANPSINALPVNSIAWGDNPTTKDTIEVYNDKNICYNLQWNMKKKEWGRSAKVWDDTFKAYRSKWQNDFTIPAGTGVRYKRCGGAFTITISADQVKETVQSGTGE